MNRRRRSLLVLPVLLAIVVAACGGGSDSASKKRTTTTSSSSTTPTTTAPAVPVAPLTGLPDPSGQSLTRPVLSVKIENSPEARPQTGLDVADVVYEQVAEGGITRFLAMFNSTIPDVLGPVRSVRAMDPDIVWPVGGIFVFSGGAPPNVALINAAPVNTIDENNAGDAFFRDHTRRAPHNLFGRGPALVAHGGQPVPVPALFQYRTPQQTVTGDPVAAFTVLFMKGFQPTYLWDAPSRTWKRSYGFAPFTATSGAQIAPANVIVQLVGCCIDSTGGARNIVVGSGTALIFTDGKVVHGTWSRPAREQVTQFLDASGQPVKLQPGPTWVEFMPTPGFGEGVVIQAPQPAAAPASTP